LDINIPCDLRRDMPTESLRPKDLFDQKLVAPVTVLKEQAAPLRELSNRKILG
jgi:hypothetical protein